MRQKQIREKYETELQNITTLERTLWHTINQENGLNNLKCWDISCKLSIELTKFGERLIKENDYEQAEMYLMRAQQFTEPALDKTIWIHQVEWFYQRLNIALNLQIIYSKQKRYSSCFDVLNQITEQCEKSHLFERIWQNIESNIDFAYYQLLVTCMEQQKYVQAFAYCKKCISIIDYYEREYNKQKRMVDNNQQELLIQTYGEERGFIYLQHKQILQKKLTLRIYSFYQGGRALHKTGNKMNSLKFFKMAWKKSQELIQDNSDNKVSMFFKKYEKVKNELEFDKNLNNESIDDFSKFTLEVKKASILNQQKQTSDNLDSQKSIDPEQVLRKKNNPEMKNVGSINSLGNELDAIARAQQDGLLNLPNNGIQSENYSDFLFSQNSLDIHEKHAQKKQKKIEFVDMNQIQDSNNKNQGGEFELMLKRQESRGSRKNTFLSNNQATTISPKKTFSTNTTPKNAGRSTINFQTTITSGRQDTQSPYNPAKNLRKKKAAVSVHMASSTQGLGRSGSQSSKFGNQAGVSPQGAEPSVFSFTQAQQNRNNLSNQKKQQYTRPQTGDGQKNKRKLSSLEGITINSNSSLSYQSLGSGKVDEEDFRNEIVKKDKKSLSSHKQSKSPLRDEINNSFQNLLIQFHYPKTGKISQRQTSKVQKARPLTANPSRNTTLSENERKKGKFSSILGNNQLSSYASSMIGGQNGTMVTTDLITNKNQQTQGEILENKTQQIRNQLNYFLKGRKASNERDAVKQIRKYYESTFGKSTEIQEDKTSQDQTNHTVSAAKKVIQVNKNAKSQSTYQAEGLDIVTALDMNQFLQNQQQKLQQNSAKSNGYLNTQSAKSFISNIFTNSQHPTPSITTQATLQRPSSSISKAQSKGSFHVPASVHSVQNSVRGKRQPSAQSLSRKSKGSKSQHISSNQFYFPTNAIDINIQEQKANKHQQNQTLINFDELKPLKLLDEFNQNNQDVIPETYENQEELAKNEMKSVNFRVQQSLETQLIQKSNENNTVVPDNNNFVENKQGSHPVIQLQQGPNATQFRKLSNHRKLKSDQTSHNSINQQTLNFVENDILLDVNAASSVKISAQDLEPSPSPKPLGNYFIFNPNQKVNNKLLRKQTMNVQKVQGIDNTMDQIQTRKSKSKTIDYSQKAVVDKGFQNKLNFILNDSQNNNTESNKDKKSKIYKQIDDMFQKDPTIQSKLNSQLMKISSPHLLPTPSKYSKSKIEVMNQSEFQLTQNDEQYSIPIKTSLKMDGSDHLKINLLTPQINQEEQQQQQIKNDSNLIDFVQQQKLNMVVLTRPVSGILKHSKSKNLSPEGLNETLMNNRTKQFTIDNQRGQKYQQMIDGGEQDQINTQLHTSNIPWDRIRDKKDSVASTLHVNSFATYQQHSINYDTKGSIRNRQQSEYIPSSNQYKIGNSGFSKLRRQETQASFTNLTQQQLQSYYTKQKFNSNLLQTSQSIHSGNLGQSTSHPLQRKQSIHKQNSITGINNKKQSISINPQQQGSSKINAKTVVSLAAMPEDELDQEDEQNVNNKFFKDNNNNNEATSENDQDSQIHSKNLLSKSGQNAHHDSSNYDISIHNTDSKKLKIILQQTPVQEQQKAEEKQKKVNMSLLILSDISSSESQVSFDKKSLSQQSPNTGSNRKRRVSDQQFQRRSLLKDSIIQELSDLKSRVNKHRESINEMIMQKRNQAASLIQQFWRAYLSGFKNQIGNDQGVSMSTGNNIEGPTTSIMENKINANNSSFQIYTNSNIVNQTNQNLKFSKNNISGLQININQNETSTNQGGRQKKKSDGSFNTQLSIKKPSGLGFMNHLSPSPQKYQKSQHFFPKVIESIPPSMGSQSNISLQPVQYNPQSLMPHQAHTFHKSVSISSPKIMSYFTEYRKNKLAIEARKNINDIQIKPALPLKFYLYQYQIGLQFWKINNFIANIIVLKDDVFVNMNFDMNVQQFQGILSIKFKIGVQDLQNLSQTKKATKWSLASGLLNYYFKSKNIYKKWENFQQDIKNPDKYSSFILLDGMEEQRDRMLIEEEKAIKKFEELNKEPFQFRSDSTSYLEQDDIHIQELVQVFERLSFFILNYTTFTKKINGQVIEISDNQLNQIGYATSNTSILERSNIKHNYYERNLKKLRIFIEKRKAKVRELEIKSQYVSHYAIDKKFHLVTNPNLPDQTTNIIYSGNKLSSTTKKISTLCSIDDAINEEQRLQLQKNMYSAQILSPNMNQSAIKRNISLREGSQNFIKLIRNESGIDSPITPGTIFGKDQEVTALQAEGLDIQDPISSQTSILLLNNQQRNINNNSFQSIDLQTDLIILDENISKIKNQKDIGNAFNFMIKTSSQNNLPIMPNISSNQKRFSSVVTNQNQQYSPQQNNTKSPQTNQQGQNSQQISNNALSQKGNTRRSSLFFQKMMEQRLKEVVQNTNQMHSSSNTPMTTSKQDNSPTPKKLMGEDFQEYLDENSVIPNFLHSTPKNSQTPISPLNPPKNDLVTLKSPIVSPNLRHQMFLSQQQYAPLSQSFRNQVKNQISFFEEDYQNIYNDSLEIQKKGSEYNQDPNDSDQQMLLTKYNNNNQKISESSQSPNNLYQEESMETPMYNSEQFRNDLIRPYQNFKRAFKKATTILEENQEDALQQSVFQTKNNLQNSNNFSESKQIGNIKEQDSSIENQSPQLIVTSPQNKKETIRQLDLKKQKHRMRQILYWNQFRYFEEHNNNKHVYIPELYINPFYQKQTNSSLS